MNEEIKNNTIAQMTTEIKYIKKDISDIKDDIKKLPTKTDMELANERLVERIFKEVKSEYVSKTEFDPIKRIIYWTIGIGGTAVVSSIIYSVLK